MSRVMPSAGSPASNASVDESDSLQSVLAETPPSPVDGAPRLAWANAYYADTDASLSLPDDVSPRARDLPRCFSDDTCANDEAAEFRTTNAAKNVASATCWLGGFALLATGAMGIVGSVLAGVLVYGVCSAAIDYYAASHGTARSRC